MVLVRDLAENDYSGQINKIILLIFYHSFFSFFLHPCWVFASDCSWGMRSYFSVCSSYCLLVQLRKVFPSFSFFPSLISICSRFSRVVSPWMIIFWRCYFWWICWVWEWWFVIEMMMIACVQIESWKKDKQEKDFTSLREDAWFSLLSSRFSWGIHSWLHIYFAGCP